MLLILDALGALIGSFVSADASRSNNAKQIKAQQEQAREQNAWQSAENEKDRQFQTETWNEQFAQENAEYDRRFQQANEYNDPSAVVARLRAAGINPAAAMGQLTGTGGMAAAGGSSQPGAPAFAPPHQVSAVGIQNPNNVINIGSVISSLADMMNAQTNAKKYGLESRYQDETLELVKGQMKSNIAYQDSLSTLNQIEAEVARVFKKPQASAELMRTLNQATMFAMNGDLAKAEKELTQAQERLINLRGDIYEEGKSALLNLIGLYGQNLKASTQAHFASASRDIAETETINQTREYDVAFAKASAELERYKSWITKNEHYISTNTKNEQVNLIMEQFKQSQLLTSTMEEQLRQAVFRGDWQLVDKIVDYMKTGSEIYENLKSIPIKQQDADSRQRSSEAFERDVEYREHDREVARRREANKKKKGK